MAATTTISKSGTQSFPTDARGLDGLARLSAGGGFWNSYFQVGGSGWVVAIIGAVLLGLAVVGTRLLADDVRRPLVVLGVIGWVVSSASALGGVSWLFAQVDDRLLGGIWRDGQRLLTLHLLWLAPAAAAGGELVASWCRHHRPVWSGPALAGPLALGIALATPGVWGFGGQLAADRLPGSWDTVRHAVRSEPGTVLALPWHQYFNLSVGDGQVRRVLDPLPLFLGGDVLASSDNGLAPGVREVGDPREPAATLAVDALMSGRAASDELVALGVRWVVVLETPLADSFDGLDDDSDVSLVVDEPDIRLYRIDRWVGPAVDANGASVDLGWHGQALGSVGAADGPVVVHRAGGGGWRSGGEPARTDPHGLLVVEGDGLLWNVGVVPAVAAQVAWLLAVAWSIRRIRRGRSMDPPSVHAALQT